MFNWYNPKPEPKSKPQLKAKAPTAPLPLSPMYLIQFFAYSHLPEFLQNVSRPFYDLANRIATVFPENPEAASALRKLLEAKDCAVRAALMSPTFDEVQQTFLEKEAAKVVSYETEAEG